MPEEVGTKTLVAKLAEACDAVGGVEKKGVNQEQRYKYVRAADVAMAIRHELFRRGIVILQNESAPEYVLYENPRKDGTVSRQTECRIGIEYRITDGTETLSMMGYSAARDSSDKSVFKAKTGALKYFLRGLGLIPDEKEDPEYDGEEKESVRTETHPEIDWQDVVDKIAAAKNAEQFNACIPLVDDYIASVPEAVNKIAAKDYFAGKAREKGFRWNRDERRFVPDEQSATDLTPALQASVKALADKKAMEAQPATGKPAERKQNPNATITEKQFGRLWAIAKSAGFDETQVRELAGAHGWEGHLKEMTAGIYDKVCADLQTYVTGKEARF